MAKEDRPARGRGAKEERKPIFERLQPFAPWDQRNAPNLLSAEVAAARAGRLAAASEAFAAAAARTADDDGAPQAAKETLAHTARTVSWHASVWRDHLGGSSDADGKLSALCQEAAGRQNQLEATAVMARVCLPQMLGEAVLLQAELGDDLDRDQSRWFTIVTDDLESARAELELVLQSQLGPGDGTRLAAACAEVARTVC
ncbi:MAG: hypothetical protein KY395_07475 [Actinobacteria bacterium]|nr:hypothetical protein [Actinomycetota bacterium]